MFQRRRVGNDSPLENLPRQHNEITPFLASPVRSFGSPVAKKFQQVAAGSGGPPALAGCRQTTRSVLSDPRGMDLAAKVQEQEARLHPLRPLPRALATTTAKPKALEAMEAFIEAETTLLQSRGEGNPGSYERLNIYRQAFTMFTGAVKVYKPFLEGVVQEYENFITQLELRLDTPGKAKQEVFREFEAELQNIRIAMSAELVEKEDEVVRRQKQLDEREARFQEEVEKLSHENERLQQELSRLHDQNLSLAHNLVDYRFQSQKAERELKEAEQVERRYNKLQTEHQNLLDSVAQGAVYDPLKSPQAHHQPVFPL